MNWSFKPNLFWKIWLQFYRKISEGPKCESWRVEMSNLPHEHSYRVSGEGSKCKNFNGLHRSTRPSITSWSFYSRRSKFDFLTLTPSEGTVVRTNKGRTNKGQITFFRKIYWALIRDKYFGKNFYQAKCCRFFI